MTKPSQIIAPIVVFPSELATYDSNISNRLWVSVGSTNNGHGWAIAIGLNFYIDGLHVIQQGTEYTQNVNTIYRDGVPYNISPTRGGSLPDDNRWTFIKHMDGSGTSSTTSTF